MKIVRNDRLVKRNMRIAQISTLAGLAVLGLGMFFSFKYQDAAQLNISIIALIIGFTLSQVGIYFSNRWGRKPRPDQLIDQSLKGLDNRHTIYHYTLPASHVLIGPSGVWVLLPQYQRGVITFQKGRWKQRGGGVMLGYLKLFAQEGLGRPDLEVTNEVDNVRRTLSKVLPEGASLPEVQAAVVFTNPKTEIQIDEDETPPAYTVPIAKLKETIRKVSKGKLLPPEKALLIQDALGFEAVED